MEHRERASTKDASVTSDGKMSAAERRAAVQASLAKRTALPKVAKPSSKPPASTTTSTLSSVRDKPSVEPPLLKSTSKRQAQTSSSVSRNRLQEKQDKVKSELKTNMEHSVVATARKDSTPKQNDAKAPSSSGKKSERDRSGLSKKPEAVASPTPTRNESPSLTAANPIAALKGKRAQSQVKPVDFSSLLGVAQVNAQKSAGAANSVRKGRASDRVPSDDDEPAGRALIEGPRRVVDRSELHIRGAGPSSRSSAAAKPPSNQHATKPHSGAQSRLPSSTSGRVERCSASGVGRAVAVSESKPKKLSNGISSDKTQSKASASGSASANDRGVKSVMSSRGLQQTRLDSFSRAEDDEGKPKAAKANTQSRITDVFPIDPQDASSSKSASKQPLALETSNKPAGLQGALPSASKRPPNVAAPNEDSQKKKAKERKKRGPVWMQEEDWSDADDPDAEDVDVSKYIRRIFGYDKQR